MALTINHAKVSGLGPAADPSKIGGDDWDADHVIVGGVPELLDLGTVDVTDLLAGPVTVYSVPAGAVVLGIYAGDATAPDVAYAYVYVAGLQSDGPVVVLDYASAGPDTTPSGWVSPGADIRASVAAYETGPWAAATVYPANAYVIEAGHLWFTDGGTSGGSEPDFAGNIGGTVGDNGMTWTDETAVPTTGSVHVYALIGTPVLP